MIGYLAAQGSTGDSPASYSFSSTTCGGAEAAGAAAAEEGAIANVASMQMNNAKVCLLALLIFPSADAHSQPAVWLLLLFVPITSRLAAIQ